MFYYRNPTPDERRRLADRSGDILAQLIERKRTTGSPTDEALQLAANLNSEMAAALGFISQVMPNSLLHAQVAYAVQFLTMDNKEEQLLQLAEKLTRERVNQLAEILGRENYRLLHNYLDEVRYYTEENPTNFQMSNMRRHLISLSQLYNLNVQNLDGDEANRNACRLLQSTFLLVEAVLAIHDRQDQGMLYLLRPSDPGYPDYFTLTSSGKRFSNCIDSVLSLPSLSLSDTPIGTIDPQAITGLQQLLLE